MHIVAAANGFPQSHFFLGVFFILLQICESTFTNNFRQFLIDEYEKDGEKELSRLDLGQGGSFGGGNKSHVAGRQTRYRPVIFVHGLGGTAGSLEVNRQYFLQHGYKETELYATSYANASFSLATDSITCQHVLLIRRLISAVTKYTNSIVDVVAYSMGSPTSRKAILGGSCVDIVKNLGPPLTQLVHTFVAVAGANYGAKYLCAVPTISACNNVTGLQCHSQFLSDINKGYAYEGSKIFTIYSSEDEIVGYRVCKEDYLASSIAGETQAFEKHLLSHVATMYATVELQHNLTLSDQQESDKQLMENSADLVFRLKIG